jgi:pimeloyl-ACP methyl ester carboxylesterase
MDVFVLVHGTGCGGWVWKKLAQLLRESGREVYSPTLTGVGDRSHLLDCNVDLYTHIADITSLIVYEDLRDVVLVGHSYAGMVITGVAANIPERLKELVYLDAYLPDDGQSEVDLWPPDMRNEILNDISASKGVRNPPSMEFLGVTDPEVIEFAQARLTPHPIACYTQPAPDCNERSASLGHTYIHCTKSPTVPVFGPFAKKAIAKGWQYYEIPSDHMVMLTQPNKLAALLLNRAE